MIFLSKIFRILAPKFKLKFLPLSTLNFSAKIQQQFNIILWAKIQIIKNPKKKNCSYFCCKNSDTIFLNLEINRNHHKNYYNFDAKIQFLFFILLDYVLLLLILLMILPLLLSLWRKFPGLSYHFQQFKIVDKDNGEDDLEVFAVKRVQFTCVHYKRSCH